MRLLVLSLLLMAASANMHSYSDDWVEDYALEEAGTCGERAPAKYLGDPDKTSCPVCDMDCDKEEQLATGLIDESDVTEPTPSSACFMFG